MLCGFAGSHHRPAATGEAERICDRARVTLGAAGRSRRFARAAGRPPFVRLIVMNTLETQPHSYLLRGRNQEWVLREV
jgi:hypothetical protein